LTHLVNNFSRGNAIELWLDLLFGNPIGIASVLTVGVTFIVIAYIVGMFVYKSGHDDSSRHQH
jgi:hypothetical protein